MRRAAAALLLALEFLTVVRVRRRASYDGATLGASLGWFPLVGLLVGAVLLGLNEAGDRVLPSPALNALLVAAGVVLTGALHLDGLADSADGLFGGHTPERRLEIMRDSRAGSFAVAAVTLALLLAYAALTSLSGPLRGSTLLLVPALARGGMVLAVAVFPYARPAGLGRLYHDHARPWPLAAAVVSSIVVALVLFGAGGLLLCLSALGAALAIGVFMARRLGGLTGDSYGAIGVLLELLLLYVAAAAVGGDWLRPRFDL